MANTKTSDLPLIPVVDRAVDLLAVVDASAGTSNKSTINNLLGITSAPVGLTDSQTLTNKTLTAPTLTSPVLSGTITGTYTLGGTPTFPATVVTTTGTQTLTNKTLSSATLTTPTITNASISADAITGFTTANSGTIYGIPVTLGTIPSAGIAANAVSNVLLDVQETTDFANALALTANTWNDLKANQNFTVSTANSIIVIIISTHTQLGGANGGSHASRLVVDSGGTPINKGLGGGEAQTATGFLNPFAGAQPVIITGLSVGVHTIKTQLYPTVSGSAAYCRAATVPNEFYRTTVLELRK